MNIENEVHATIIMDMIINKEPSEKIENYLDKFSLDEQSEILTECLDRLNNMLIERARQSQKK